MRWNQKYAWIIWANCQRDVGVAVAMVDFLIMGPMYVEEQDGSFMWEGIREGARTVKNKTAVPVVVPVEIWKDFSNGKEGIKILRDSFSRNTKGETIPESMEATCVLSLKGRGKKMAWPATEVLGKVFCYIVAVSLGGEAVIQYVVKQI